MLNVMNAVIVEYLKQSFVSNSACSVRNAEIGRKPLTNCPTWAASILHAAISIDTQTKPAQMNAYSKDAVY